MIEVVKMLGADKDIADKQMSEVVDFEASLQSLLFTP